MIFNGWKKYIFALVVTFSINYFSDYLRWLNCKPIFFPMFVSHKSQIKWIANIFTRTEFWYSKAQVRLLWAWTRENFLFENRILLIFINYFMRFDPSDCVNDYLAKLLLSACCFNLRIRNLQSTNDLLEVVT